MLQRFFIASRAEIDINSSTNDDLSQNGQNYRNISHKYGMEAKTSGMKNLLGYSFFKKDFDFKDLLSQTANMYWWPYFYI